MFPDFFSTIAERKTYAVGISSVLHEFIPLDATQIIVGYIMDCRGKELMWRLLSAEEPHLARMDLVGFVVPMSRDLDWARNWIHSAFRSEAFIPPIFAFRLTNGIDTVDIIIDITWDGLAHVPYSDVSVAVSIDHFWNFLSEHESPLAFILTEQLQNADHVAKLRKVFRYQLANYAVRVLCAEAAAEKQSSRV